MRGKGTSGGASTRGGANTRVDMRLTKGELVEIANSLNLDVPDSATKKEIIELIEESRR